MAIQRERRPSASLVAPMADVWSTSAPVPCQERPASSLRYTLPSGVMPTMVIGSANAAVRSLGPPLGADQVFPLSRERQTPSSVVARTTVLSGLPTNAYGEGDIGPASDHSLPSTVERRIPSNPTIWSLVTVMA